MSERLFPPAARQQPPRAPEREQLQSVGTISTPVGVDEQGVVFAYVRFDSEIRKEYVENLKKYLVYLESTLG